MSVTVDFQSAVIFIILALILFLKIFRVFTLLFFCGLKEVFYFLICGETVLLNLLDEVSILFIYKVQYL